MSVLLTMEDVSKYVPTMSHPINVHAKMDLVCTIIIFVQVR